MIPHADRPGPVLRVLAADADGDARALYREVLGTDGCEVVEASDGRDALVKAFVCIPALVITELQLPGIDGFALCDILRRDRSTANVPIVVATSETSERELTRARQVADTVIVKPATGDSVLKECARLLQRIHSLGGRVAKACNDISEFVAGSATRLSASAERGQQRRPVAAQVHSRYTTTVPPNPPPALNCPSCVRPLVYELSYIGGVNDQQPEQWDYLICLTCGAYQYRHRTRRLRRLGADDEKWIRQLRTTRA